jgi:hypothetical protein
MFLTKSCRPHLVAAGLIVINWQPFTSLDRPPSEAGVF